MTERNRARRELQIKWLPKRRISRHTLHGAAADASDRFRSRAAGCYTVRDAVPKQTAGSTYAGGCLVTEQNDRQQRRERELRECPIWVKGKDDFKPRVHSLSIALFWMVPAVDMGLRLTKIQDLLKTLSANRQIQDFFKVWKRLLKTQDLFKTLRPACEPWVCPNLAPAWTLTSEFDRINWPLTSEMFIFWICTRVLQWSCLKAVSVSTFVSGGLRGFIATSDLVLEVAPKPTRAGDE